MITLPAYLIHRGRTFPKLLQKAGYQTALIGKWHLESLRQALLSGKSLPERPHINPDFITQTNDTDSETWVHH